MESRVVQKVFLRNKDGKYLFVKRSEYGARPNEWDLAGGRQDPGETLEQGLLREMREEIGHEEVDSPQLIYAHSSVREEHGDRFNYVLLLYIAGAKSDEVTLSEEHQEYVWTTLEEASSFIQHPLHKEAIASILENNLDV